MKGHGICAGKHGEMKCLKLSHVNDDRSSVVEKMFESLINKMTESEVENVQFSFLLNVQSSCSYYETASPRRLCF